MAKNKLQTYLFWGLQENGSTQTANEHLFSCPFCGHDDTRYSIGHFFINSVSGAFDCKSCGISGGIKDFLKAFYKKLLEDTRNDDLRILMKDQGIPLPTLKEHKVAFCREKRGYVIPVYDLAGKDVTDLRLYRKNRKEISTAGCSPGLCFIPELLKSEVEIPIWITESFRDALALKWLLWRTKNAGVVVSAPGANTFRDEWSFIFDKRHVTIAYDNDESGYGDYDESSGKATGSRKVALRLTNYARSISFINWPNDKPEKYDIRDFVLENKQDPIKGFSSLQSYIETKHKTDVKVLEKTQGENTSLEEIITEAKNIIELTDDIINAFKLSLATQISTTFPGTDNPWMFLVGPSGCGKSLITQSFNLSKRVIYESRLTKQALVSGWGLGRSNLDTSILAKVNNKMLVLKDFTEVLGMSEKERNDLFGILRGAYDGEVKVPFGNGVRHYPHCNFTFLAGVTNAIKSFNMSALGERFLRFNFSSIHDSEEDIQEKALNSQIFGEEPSFKLKDLVASFICNQYDDTPEALRSRVPHWFRERVKPLGRFAESLRIDVERYERGYRMGSVVYQPVRGMATRIVIQLEKLAIALSLIENKKEIDEEIYKLIYRLALDTVDSYSTNIVFALLQHGEMSRGEIQEFTGIRNVQYYLEDLQLTKIIENRSVKDNRPSYRTTKKVTDLWRRSQL